MTAPLMIKPGPAAASWSRLERLAYGRRERFYGWMQLGDYDRAELALRRAVKLEIIMAVCGRTAPRPAYMRIIADMAQHLDEMRQWGHLAHLIPKKV